MAQELAANGVCAASLFGEGDRLIAHGVLFGIAERVDVGQCPQRLGVSGTYLLEPGALSPFGEKGPAELVQRGAFAVRFFCGCVPSTAQRSLQRKHLGAAVSGMCARFGPKNLAQDLDSPNRGSARDGYRERQNPQPPSKAGRSQPRICCWHAAHLPGFAAVVKREVASRARHTVGEGTSGSPPTRTPPNAGHWA